MTEVVPVTVGILQTLTPSPQYYRGFYPHSCGITTTNVPITAVLLQSPLPSQSLICIEIQTNRLQNDNNI